MPLAKRSLQVTFAMPSGNVVLDETLDLHVNIHKNCLAIGNTCAIEVYNLSQTLRQSLLSQFTLWNKREIQSGTGNATAQPQFINVTIQAGYVKANGQNTQTTIYVGQVVSCEPISGPPKIGVRIACNSQMIYKGMFKTNVPPQMTYKQYAEWVGLQLQVDRTVCKTSYDDKIVVNPSMSTAVREYLLLDLQNAFRPAVAAYIDNNMLIVRDQGAILTTDAPYEVNEFIGTPLWTEWGAKFQCLFDPEIQLSTPVVLNSKLNPSLAQTFIVTTLDYNLTSRQVPFYVAAEGNPTA